MKDIRPKLVNVLKLGFCTPLVGQIAKKLKEPSTTIHYNIKKLEHEGTIKAYKAVFDYKSIDEGHCTYILVNLVPDKYGDPESVAKQMAKHPQVESVDIVTGEYELLLKLRNKNIDEYYEFVKTVIKMYGVAKVVSLTSLKQMKTEFVEV